MSATAVKSDTLLDVRDLRVAYREGGRVVPIVDGVSFTLRSGEALGLAGESGCGKTTTALALLGLLPSGLRRTRGEITLNSTRGVMLLHRRTPTGWRDVRWRTASMVFQGAMNALDPVMRIDRQIAEAILLHAPGADADARVAELLERVGIPSARRRQYPHEFSGGMRQRVMIALALACGPELIIGDEPTTALDVMTQGQILQLLEELRRDLGLALLLITHDLSVIAETCDRVAVMYAGQIAEQGPVRDILASPQHPYTGRLLAGLLPRRRPARARRGDPRLAAASRRGLPRLPLRAALPPRLRRLRQGAAAAAHRPHRTARLAACWPSRRRPATRSTRRAGCTSPTSAAAGRPCARWTGSTSPGGAARRSAWWASRAAASRRSRARCSGWRRPSAGTIEFDGPAGGSRPARPAAPRPADLPGSVPVAEPAPHGGRVRCRKGWPRSACPTARSACTAA